MTLWRDFVWRVCRVALGHVYVFEGVSRASIA